YARQKTPSFLSSRSTPLSGSGSWKQATALLLTDRGRPVPPSRGDKAAQEPATAAGTGHVYPHQLRHTLANQAINRAMSLEAIATLLGRHDQSMPIVYTRIADRPSPRSTSPPPRRSMRITNTTTRPTSYLH